MKRNWKVGSLLFFSVCLLAVVPMAASVTQAALSKQDKIIYNIHNGEVKSAAQYVMTVKEAGADGTSITVELSGEGTDGKNLPFISNWMEIDSKKMVDLNTANEIVKIEIPGSGEEHPDYIITTASKTRKGAPVQQIQRLIKDTGKTKSYVEEGVSILSMEALLTSIFNDKFQIDKQLFWVEEKRAKRMKIVQVGETELSVPDVGSMAGVTQYEALQLNQKDGTETPMFNIYVDKNNYPVFIQAKSGAWAISLQKLGKSSLMKVKTEPIAVDILETKQKGLNKGDYSLTQNSRGGYNAKIKTTQSIPKQYYSKAASAILFKRLTFSKQKSKYQDPPSITKAPVSIIKKSTYVINAGCEELMEHLKTARNGLYISGKCEYELRRGFVSIETLVKHSFGEVQAELWEDTPGWGAAKAQRNTFTLRGKNKPQVKNYFFQTKDEKKSDDIGSVAKDWCKDNKKECQNFSFAKEGKVEGVRYYRKFKFDVKKHKKTAGDVLLRSLYRVNPKFLPDDVENNPYLKFKEGNGYYIQVSENDVKKELCDHVGARFPGCSGVKGTYKINKTVSVGKQEIIKYFKNNNDIDKGTIISIKTGELSYKSLKPANLPQVKWED